MSKAFASGRRVSSYREAINLRSGFFSLALPVNNLGPTWLVSLRLFPMLPLYIERKKASAIVASFLSKLSSAMEIKWDRVFFLCVFGFVCIVHAIRKNVLIKCSSQPNRANQPPLSRAHEPSHTPSVEWIETPFVRPCDSI